MKISACWLYAISEYGYPPSFADTIRYFRKMAALGFKAAELETFTDANQRDDRTTRAGARSRMHWPPTISGWSITSLSCRRSCPPMRRGVGGWRNSGKRRNLPVGWEVSPSKPIHISLLSRRRRRAVRRGDRVRRQGRGAHA